jgi:hypothetical protein
MSTIHAPAHADHVGLPVHYRRARRAAVALSLMAVLLGVAVWAVVNGSRPSSLVVPGLIVTEMGEVRTGHQRADRVAFVGDGSILATLAPRYNYLTLDRVAMGQSLRVDRMAEVRLGGRPVAMAAAPDRLYVLQRPSGDARHLEPAWWDTVGFDGSLTGPRVRVGFDPDDLALSDDGATAFVLLSGSAEGESNRPGPSLAVFDLAATADGPKIIAELPFDGNGDDPERMALAGTRAAVALRGSNQVAWVDLSDRERPRLLARVSLPGGEGPASLQFDRSGRLIVSGGEDGHLWDLGAGPTAPPRLLGSGLTAWANVANAPTARIGAIEDGSAIEIWTEDVARGRLRLGGWGGVRPLDVAWRSDPDGDGTGLAAIGDRSGGVHLVRVERGSTAR